MRAKTKTKIIKCQVYEGTGRCRRVARYYCKQEVKHFCAKHAVPACCKLLIPSDQILVSRAKLMRISSLIQYPFGVKKLNRATRTAVKLIGKIVK